MHKMHVLDNSVRLQDEVIPVSRYFGYRAIVASASPDSSASPMRKIEQDLVEQSVFAESTQFH